MHWDVYTTFSVISGIMLFIIAGTIKDSKPRDRAWVVLGGLISLVYGIFVSTRTSGFFVFSVWIFIVPFVGAGFLIHRALKRRREAEAAAKAAPAKTRER